MVCFMRRFILRKKYKVILLVIFWGILSCFLSAYGMNVHMKSKIQIERKAFLGTFAMNESTNERIAIEGMSAEKISDNHNYEVYNENGVKLFSGQCKIMKDNYVVMYSNNKPKATLFYTNEKFFFTENGKKCEEIKKISKSAVFP